jgi:hypothetical protein
VDFLDDLIAEPFEKLGTDFRANFTPGQICQTPVLYSYENGELWRPSAWDASGTMATHFVVTSKPGDAYKQEKIIGSPKLEYNEEFPVVRAKYRPVVLLVPCPQEIAIKDVRGGGKINRHLCLVSPCYSVADRAGKAKFRQEFLDKVRILEYPHFMFLPKSACLTNDSLLRLDSIQHVFHNELEPTQWRLCDELMEILRGQLTYLMTKVYGGAYAYYRNELQKTRP